VRGLKEAAPFHFDGESVAVMLTQKPGRGGLCRGYNFLSCGNGANEELRICMLQVGIEAIAPPVTLAHGAGPLFERMRAAL
jgi:hypothetical protein